MFVGGVVQHQIQFQQHVFGTEGFGDFADIRHRAETFFHRTIVTDRIAAVVCLLRHFQQWHQVHIIHTQFFQIVDLLHEAFQIFTETIDIQHGGDPVRAHDPIFVFFALTIEIP